MRWVWLVAVLAVPVEAAQVPTVEDPRALLLEARKKVMETVNALPRYLCTETVDRAMATAVTRFESSSCEDLASARKKSGWKVRRSVSDRLRLDVAVSSDSEMYSWVGEDRFRDRSLADLVGTGATSTGAFSSFLTSIFGSNDARFTYKGTSTTDGRTLAEFGFVVPLENSHYSVGTKLHRATVGYDGTFLVDRKTSALVQLTIRADHLAADLGACQSITTLNYETVRLNGVEFLLPKSAGLYAITPDGGELDNRTVFSGCHEFHGESTLHFDPLPEIGTATARSDAAKVLALPAALPFTLTLANAIDTRTAAAGDVVRAKLVSAIRDKGKQQLVAKGAVVAGRIVQIEMLYGLADTIPLSLRVGIKLESIEVNGIVSPFSARLESTLKTGAWQDPASRLFRQPLNLSSFNQISDPAADDVGYLVFEDATRDFVIHAGFQMAGKTAAPAKQP